MSHNSYTKASGIWTDGVDTIDAAALLSFEQKMYKAVNGDDGGTWAPSTPIDIGGAGMILDAPARLATAGRIIPTVTLGADADTTYNAGSANVIIRVTSAVTANHVYTMSSVGVSTNDVITIYCEPSFTNEITVRDQFTSTNIFALGSKSTSDNSWVTLIYIGGWRVMSGHVRNRLVEIAQFTTATGGDLYSTGVNAYSDYAGSAVTFASPTKVGDIVEVFANFGYRAAAAAGSTNVRIAIIDNATETAYGGSELFTSNADTGTHGGATGAYAVMANGVSASALLQLRSFGAATTVFITNAVTITARLTRP